MVFFIPLVFFSLSLISSSAGAAPQVKVRGTTLVGRDITQSNVDFFGGIPFAEPPVGARRFRSPVLKTRIKEVSTFDASNFGKSCLQLPAFLPLGPISEDCLTVNIYRPTGTNRNSRLPVLVWAYGGAFVGGGADGFNGSALVARSVERETPMIYVNFNYRLGPFGYPQGQEAHDRRELNLALKDMLTALKWVQTNIKFFGGDNRAVTIFGESAGAMNIGALYFTTDLATLVRGAILQSGSANSPALYSAPEREAAWQAFVRSVPSCAPLASSSNTFSCLQNASEAEIRSAYLAGPGGVVDVLAGLAWTPTIDAGPGGLIPDFPSKLYQQGKLANIPFIAGTNLDEGTAFSTAFMAPNATSEFLRSAIPLMSSPPPNTVDPASVSAAADQLMVLYPDDPALGSPYGTGAELFGLPRVYKRASSMQGDQTFDAARRRMSEAAAQLGVKSYGYLFTDPQPFTGPIGVHHGADVAYFYPPNLSVGPPAGSASTASEAPAKRQAAASLATTMMDYWISFTTSLDPNDNKGSSRPVWPEYTSANKVLLQLHGANTTVINDDFRQAGISFLNTNALLFRR